MKQASFAGIGSKHRRILFIVIIVVVIALASSIFTFKSNLDLSLQNNTAERLMDVMDSQRALVKAHMSGMLRELDVDALAVARDGVGDVDAVRSLLDSSVASGNFTWLGFTDIHGELRRTSGEWYNVSDTNAFKSALSGKNYITTQNEMVVISVPVQDYSGMFVGMLSGGYPVSKLTEFASDFVRKYDSCVCIVQQDGKLLTSLGNTERLTGRWSNLNDMLDRATYLDGSSAQRVRDSMDVAVRDKTLAQLDGKKLLLAYAPMEISDWYLFSVVPYSFVERDASRISRDAYDISIKLVLAFSMLLAYMLITNRRQLEVLNEQQKEMRATSARYKLISARSKDIIVEYDLKKGFVVHCENAGILSSPEFSKVNFIQCAVERGVIYPEDAGIFHDSAHEVASGSSEDVELDLRLKLGSNGSAYNWYHLSMACVYAEDGRPWRVVARAGNIDHQKREQQRLEQKAVRDPLTKLYNKGATRSEIGRALSCDPDRTHALMIIDIDNFKRFNDSYGHMFGDHVLTGAAEQLTALFRSSDVVGRVGGDEFMVFCRNIGSPENALLRAQKVCDMFHSVGLRLDPPVDTSCSVGVALSPYDGSDFEQLYGYADAALYTVKKGGKDNCALYQTPNGAVVHTESGDVGEKA